MPALTFGFTKVQQKKTLTKQPHYNTSTVKRLIDVEKTFSFLEKEKNLLYQCSYYPTGSLLKYLLCQELLKAKRLQSSSIRQV